MEIENGQTALKAMQNDENSQPVENPAVKSSPAIGERRRPDKF